MQNINVNIVPDSYPQTIRYSQGDVGREFKINVVGFTIPTGATVKIQATKPSGFGFSVAGTVAGDTVSFTTTAIMTDEAGRFPAELEITKDSVVIGTANFIMWGEANPHPEGTTDGQQGTIIPELTLLVERVEAAASSILDMEVVAETLPAGSQATYSYDEDLNKATFGIPQGEAGAGAAGVVADAYSSSKTYKVGDYVLHNSNLYRCITAITTAEAFTAAHWTQIVLANDVSDLKSDLSNVENVLNIPQNFIDCRGFASGNESNWSVTSSRNSVTVTHLRTYTGGIPTLLISLPMGKYIFSADFSSANIAYMTLLDSTDTRVMYLTDGAVIEVSEETNYKITAGNGASDQINVPCVFNDVGLYLMDAENEIAVINKKLNTIFDFNVSTYDGYLLDDGTIRQQSDKYEKYTSYIPVYKTNLYTKFAYTNASKWLLVAYCEYDSSKTFLRKIILRDGTSSTESYESTITTSQDAYYVRFTYYSFNENMNNVYKCVDLISQIFEDDNDLREELNIEAKESSLLTELDGKFQLVGYSAVENDENLAINTVNMYEYVATHGYDLIKGDIRITSDNKLVMCHDAGFTFTSDGKIASTFDPSNYTAINTMTLSQVLNLEYEQVTTDGDIQKVATFEDFVKVGKKYGKPLYPTVRNQSISTIVPLMLSILDKYNMRYHCIVNSMTFTTCQAFRSEDSKLAICFTTSDTPTNAIIDSVKNLGNCIFGYYCIEGSSTSVAQLETLLANISSVIDYAKQNNVRFWTAIARYNHFETLLNYGVGGTHTLTTWQ